jgi:DNA-binding NtrC family response regulator
MALAHETALHVLVVKDKYLIALRLTEWMAERGWTVVAMVASVEQALRLLRSPMRIDAVTLDMNLNGEMAYDLVDLLDERDIPFVVVTGYEPNALKPRLRRCTVVRKPINFDRLALELEEACGRRWRNGRAL